MSAALTLHLHIPPIAKAKGSSTFANERRRVVIVFIFTWHCKSSSETGGINESHLNDVYLALKSVLAKFEGLMRFLFETKDVH